MVEGRTAAEGGFLHSCLSAHQVHPFLWRERGPVHILPAMCKLEWGDSIDPREEQDISELRYVRSLEQCLADSKCVLGHT